MADDLRERIAAVIMESCHGVFMDDAVDAADAVISELGLQPETLYNPGRAILSRLDGKVLADNRYMTRWATPWEADESPVR